MTTAVAMGREGSPEEGKFFGAQISAFHATNEISHLSTRANPNNFILNKVAENVQYL
jgi:hypothetical protein